jgi:CBS domain containing-hemolysin-like protein
MTLLITFFLLSISFSFLCSIWEAVLLSITPSHAGLLEKTDPTLSHKIKVMKEEIDRPLSAILSLNTIAHTVGAIGVGSQAGKLFGSTALPLALFSISYESIIAGLMTLAILVLSEIIPKTIGANYWKRLTPFTVISVNILLLVLSPLVWLSQWITKHLKKDKKQSVLSRADVAAVARIGAESGVLNESESRIIHNLLKLRQVKVKDIMTPRTVVVAADESVTVDDFHQEYRRTPYSRIPIYTESIDHISGVVLKDDILTRLAEDRHDVLLQELKREISMVEKDLPIPSLFDTLLQKRDHMVIVVDEYGGMLGLVTMEDILETMLGLEIVDETDMVADLQRMAKRKWEERAKKLDILECEPEQPPAGKEVEE